MAFTWEDTKRLARLQGLAEELLAGARATRGPETMRMIDQHLDKLMDEIAALLEGADAVAAAEFHRTVRSVTGGWSGAPARAAAVVGWLRGAVEAESLERRIAAEAQAYGEERARQERGVGFAAPP
jgi:hypothetical protein